MSSYSSSSLSLGSSFFTKKKMRHDSVLTAEGMRIELQYFMTDTLQIALEDLRSRVKGDVRDELELYFKYQSVAQVESEEINEGSRLPSTLGMRTFPTRTRVRPYLGIAARYNAAKDAKLEAESRPHADNHDQSMGASVASSPARIRGNSSPTEFASPLCSPRDRKTGFVLEAHGDGVKALPDNEDELDESSYLIGDDDPDTIGFNPNAYGVARRSAHSISSARDVLRSYVQRSSFENAVGFLVVMNAIMLGVETDYKASGEIADSDFIPNLMEVSEVVFCVIFSLELTLRILAYGCDFFTNRNWGWNVFDCLVVGFQVTEQVVNLIQQSHLSQLFPTRNTHIMHVLHILRFVRITRLVRVVRLVDELHTIMTSITTSMMALFWTLLLLIMLIYIISVFFTQVGLELESDSKHKIQIDYYYGRLPRALLTMFEVIAGGVSWDSVLEPMMEDVSPVMGVVFTLYIAFCVFAMMNMATGIFVDRAIRKAQEDRDNYTANHISRLFFADEANLDDSSQITPDIFVRKIETSIMQEYFKAINVDPSEARGLFQLLDVDNSGTVDAEELVNGCMRLRGHAKALELSLIRHDLNQMFRTVFKALERTNRKINNINGFIKDMQGSPDGDNGVGHHSSGDALRCTPSIFTATPSVAGSARGMLQRRPSQNSDSSSVFSVDEFYGHDGL